MAYWNHFADAKYKQIKFSEVAIGEKFRKNFFKNKRRRKDIICIKLRELEFEEQKSKKIYKILFVSDSFIVSHFELLNS